MSLEDQRLAPPPASQCIEAGCDRPATEGDERCELHQVRLGRRPSQPSGPRPRIVERALDAPAPMRAVSLPPAVRSRDRWLALGGWGLGCAGVYGSLALGIELHLSRYPEMAWALLSTAAGALATFGAIWFTIKTSGWARRLLGVVLALISLAPTLLLVFVLYQGFVGLYGNPRWLDPPAQLEQ